MTVTHFMYVPFTGLGLYNGHRGRRWLRNRITVFKQFVVPSLQNQTNQNFKVWISWRREDQGDKDIDSLFDYLVNIFGEDRVVFTYSGVCFWDDKYPDDEAHDRLAEALESSTKVLMDYIGDVSHVLMTIQPSDDMFRNDAVDTVQKLLNKKNVDACGFTKGYIGNYKTLEVCEYNPKTNPPFYTIKFTKEDFCDPYRHLTHTGPYKSHEYVPDFLKYRKIDERGFFVGTHGENISTHFNHPYAGQQVDSGILNDFCGESTPVQISYSLRKKLMQKLPHGWQRKLRYWLGECLYARFYRWIRS